MRRAKILGRYLKYSHVGLQFVLAVGLPTALGIWLDQWLGTVVLFTLLGFAFGFAAGVLSIVRDLFPKKENSRDRAAEEENGNGGKNETSADT